MIKKFSLPAYTEKKTFTALYTGFSSLALTKYKINLVRYQLIALSIFARLVIILVTKLFASRRSWLIIASLKFLLTVSLRIESQIWAWFFNKPDNKAPLLFCILYLGQYSLQIKTGLNRIVKQCYPNIQLKVIFRSPKRVGSLFRLKTSFPLLCAHLLFTGFSVLAAMPCTMEKHHVILSLDAESTWELI